MDEGRLQRRRSGSRPGGSGRRQAAAASSGEARAALAARLRERRGELEEAIATRVHAIADPQDVSDHAYPLSLEAAVQAAIDYRLEVLENGERHAPAVPAALLVQARLDARDGVPLDAVLRRYFAGNSVFGDFLVEEADRAEVPRAILQRLLATQATTGDRLLAAVSAEYATEARNRPTTAAERRRETVKSLLAGELVDHSELGYDLEGQHLALMAKGKGAEEVVKELAGKSGRRLLSVKREEEAIWACWLGGRQRLEAEEALAALTAELPAGVHLTLGEPGAGLSGWRFSHLQAKAALPVAERRNQPVLRYADVALLASVLRDDLLAGSLRQLYLVPLEQSRDGGKVARETIRAYFRAERNVSSAAAELGVDRRTVRNRVRAIEELLARPLHEVAADLEIALRLDE